jgi:murein DD-endopeptidase MepM/ murein hydrolase activator NlpD
MRMHKFLQSYPFSDPRVRIAEGFSAYDGNLGDPAGALHRGIDYVLKENGRYLPFDVFAMHDGKAYRGISPTWGAFVVIQYIFQQGEVRFDTVYAHLDAVDKDIPMFEDNGKENRSGGARKEIRAGDWIGTAGTSGATNGLIQLHVELHRKDLRTGEWEKLDPYGVYDRLSSGRYPQPAESLNGLEHSWIKDDPALTDPY